MDFSPFYTLLLENLPVALCAFALGFGVGFMFCRILDTRPITKIESFCKNPHKVGIVEIQRGNKTIAISCIYRIKGNICTQTNAPCIKL